MCSKIIKENNFKCYKKFEILFFCSSLFRRKLSRSVSIKSHIVSGKRRVLSILTKSLVESTWVGGWDELAQIEDPAELVWADGWANVSKVKLSKLELKVELTLVCIEVWAKWTYDKRWV